MPYYEFWCDCGFSKGIVRPMAEASATVTCDNCENPMYRNFKTNVGVFKPYVDRDFTGEPIEIKSASQRDALCKEHRVTMDRFRYSKPSKKKKTVVETLSYQDVKNELSKVSDEQLQAARRKDDGQRRDCFRGKVSTSEIPIP